jgi:Ca2+-binding RTX toxin-like protein
MQFFAALSIASVLSLFGLGGHPAKVVHTASTPNYEVPLSSVTVPDECAGMTFDHAFQVPAGASFTGTAGNDLIFAGDGSAVHGGDGNDCIVVQNRVSAHGDNGDDVLVARGYQNALDGGAGNDTAYYHYGSDGVRNIEVLNPL